MLLRTGLFMACSVPSVLWSQDIDFARTTNEARAHPPVGIAIGLVVDSLVVDTVYYQDPATGREEQGVQRYPLARYEYYADDALYRRIDIQQVQFADTTRGKNALTGDVVLNVERGTRDVPSGAYQEFFHNGNIRIKGRLNGYDADGRLIRTGEWREWNADGKVISVRTYP